MLCLSWTVYDCGMWEFIGKKSEVTVNFHQQLLKAGVAAASNFIIGLVMGGFGDGASLPSARILNQMGGGLVYCIKGN